MSYINREEAIRQIEEVQSLYVGQYFDLIGRTLEIIKNLPDEDVENITHGHWCFVRHYQDKASGQCSECGKMSPLRTSRDSWGMWNIDMPRCPVCGAIMDGKVNYI